MPQKKWKNGKGSLRERPDKPGAYYYEVQVYAGDADVTITYIDPPVRVGNRYKSRWVIQDERRSVEIETRPDGYWVVERKKLMRADGNPIPFGEWTEAAFAALGRDEPPWPKGQP